MIDINELRRKLGSDDIIDHVDIHANVKPTLTELINRLDAAESDALEQARLNGMGASREAELMAKLEAAEKERDALRAKIEQMEKQGPSVPDDVRKDAERYRFLEHLCATGSYRGIISRKAIDAAMLAASPEAKP